MYVPQRDTQQIHVSSLLNPHFPCHTKNVETLKLSIHCIELNTNLVLLHPFRKVYLMPLKVKKNKKQTKKQTKKQKKQNKKN